MILCVSPNPALDRILVVDHWQPGGVFRASQSLEFANGKGVSVARAARTLGAEVLCAGFLGGATGKRIAGMVEAEALGAVWTQVVGETRTNTVIVETSTGEATVINELGPAVTEADWKRLHADVVRAAARVDAICVSGSLPPGSDLVWYIDLLESLYLFGRPIWVDVSGKALAAALAVEGLNIKVNAEEAGSVFNRAIDTPEAAIVAAEQLCEHGAASVVLTLGKQGAAYASEAGRWWVRPPLVKTVSAVGSGDSFLAGLVAALQANTDVKEALRHAAAAGAANAITLGSGRFDMGSFEQIRAFTACAEV